MERAMVWGVHDRGGWQKASLQKKERKINQIEGWGCNCITKDRQTQKKGKKNL